MLGYESENRLKELLVAVGDGEIALEAARQRLCSIRDFAPHSLFQRIDRNSSDFVSSLEVLEFLRDHHVFSVSEEECFRVVKFFDSDEDKRLSFQDFLQILLPCEDNLLRNITLDRPTLRVGRYDHLPRDIEAGFVEIMEKEVELQRRLDFIKRELELRYDYSSLSAYRSVDRYNDGRIDPINLGSFLRNNGHHATEREILAIIRRVDTDGDARLSYTEFAEFLRGANPSFGDKLQNNVEMDRENIREGSPARRSSPIRSSHQASPIRSNYEQSSSPYQQQQEQQHRQPSPSRRPILRLNEEDELVRGLKEMLGLERELEQSKTTMTMKGDFNLFDLFKIFDIDNRGWCSIADLRDGLSAIGVYPTSEELELFMNRYDKNGDRMLRFNELCDAFTPHDPYYSNMLNKRNSNHRMPTYRRDDCFQPDTNIELRNLWRVHFKNELQAESLRQRLQSMPCFNLYEAFNSCDLNDNGSISADEFKRMIQSRGFYVSDKEVNDLVAKVDKKRDGRVTYAEFREEFMPKSPVKHY